MDAAAGTNKGSINCSSKAERKAAAEKLSANYAQAPLFASHVEQGSAAHLVRLQIIKQWGGGSALQHQQHLHQPRHHVQAAVRRISSAGGMSNPSAQKDQQAPCNLLHGFLQLCSSAQQAVQSQPQPGQQQTSRLARKHRQQQQPGVITGHYWGIQQSR